MSYAMPKNVCPDDVIFGVQLADRDIYIPLKTSKLPVVRYTDVEMMIPVGQKVETDKPLYYDGDIKFGFGLRGPSVVEVNASKGCSVEIEVGFGMEATGRQACLAEADIAIELQKDITGTHGHLAQVEIAHDAISTAFISSTNWDAEVELGVGVGYEIKAIASDSPDDIWIDIGVGMNAEANMYRKRVLSDLEDATLADLSDMTLQELYWIEPQ